MFHAAVFATVVVVVEFEGIEALVENGGIVEEVRVEADEALARSDRSQVLFLVRPHFSFRLARRVGQTGVRIVVWMRFLMFLLFLLLWRLSLRLL